MIISRRSILSVTLVSALCPSARANAQNEFTPEQFGAKGDGVTNDSLAMARLSAAVNMHGGGMIIFRKTTYVVGKQGLQLSGGYMFPPSQLLEFRGCSQPLTIKGNGARLLCTEGLRYGVFDQSGDRANPPMPYFGPGLAAPYASMIHIEDCTGPVAVTDFDLAGPGDKIRLGGKYGDTGWQIRSTGLVLINNRGSEAIARIHTHGHAQDGMIIDGVNDAPAETIRTVVDVVADGNGRQGCSIVGGEGYKFVRCRFDRTGRGKVSSAPGAGLDIEAEGSKRIRNIVFNGCRFADNVGCGVVADNGDTAWVRFTGCTFIGTTNWSAWPSKSQFRFDRCKFIGAITRAFGDQDPSRATQFVGCTFTDDPTQSPSGKVYQGTNSDGPLADLSNSRNVLFERCRFQAVRGVLPWSTGAIYKDCTMKQGFGKAGYPRGRFVGNNIIIGKIDLYGSVISGVLTVNGKRVQT
jgi:hypothetical protein